MPQAELDPPDGGLESPGRLREDATPSASIFPEGLGEEVVAQCVMAPRHP